MEFSKVIVTVITVFCMICIGMTYHLKYVGIDVSDISAVTISLIGTIFSVCIGYFTYQAKLKINRNKHRVNKDGIPFDTENVENSVENE
jgi:hypothetical protein